MGKITQAHRDLIKEVGLCYTASAAPDGTPNVSPKGSITVVDDDHIAFAEIMSPHTRENLQENPRVAVMVCKPETFEGFQFKGTAALTSDGAVFDMLVQAIADKGLKLPPVQNAVTIRVEDVRRIGEN
ncbi:MAG: pyridoxamine 5'-phosphate oxidase family protein [Actinomycetia bacterium]|nr:pyridoxamine 5'-phosphate oxidase family protein [Actinomycetes bacterium]MCP3939467.1 pyridoxamine 5'-phosphate oxidase family protein [Actinomycetes bacterium]MCP4086057.1 pyridoxamine 5'-phosphate oxidase family protein [Actinomycetes bacterium]